MTNIESALADTVDNRFNRGGGARQKLLEARNDQSVTQIATKQDLPPSNMKEFEASMLHYQRLAVDNERLEKEVARLKDEMAREIAARDAKIQVLSDTRTDIQTRVNECLAQRDQAVSERAVYETLFVSVVAQFAAFRIPTAPLAVEIDKT